MPEAGYIPIPRKLAEKGVKDMLRISDARMSGTAYGTIVLHVSPEAEAGGPIGVVRSGDRIKLSVAGRRLDLEVDAAELERRRAERPRSDARREARLADALSRPCPAGGGWLRPRFPGERLRAGCVSHRLCRSTRPCL